MISVVSSSLKDPDISLERERITQIQIISCLTVGVSGLQDIEKIEAKCEISGVTKIILKAYSLYILPSLRVNMALAHSTSTSTYPVPTDMSCLVQKL